MARRNGWLLLLLAVCAFGPGFIGAKPAPVARGRLETRPCNLSLQTPRSGTQRICSRFCRASMRKRR